ncbi:MAG: DivIVA domain-containing protein [Hamadaea sp.]|uniref:DivIVA domain-containing protein n=1 Tax=Hamadaea sp. TaxID=2024425 RepID=UPI0017CED768|nr:DivIVA domain-containing protein [Hamadaea sp.]NUR69610.1 DivIVA domain-containing protein [Hamadaea sp.]NUT19224.1 DivIVA domain-containing protein [Hamadaea sp.]
MAQVLLLLVVALTVGAVVFGVMVLVSGGDPGMAGVEPDGRGRPLPGSRPLVEQDVAKVTFDVALRGYRMDQVDRALKRVAYDIGYKDELINVLSAEVEALRDGRVEDADSLRAARLAASSEPEPAAASELIDGTVTESGPSIDEPGLIDLDKPAKAEEIRASQPAIDFDEVPDGPFAPWPAASDEKPSDDKPSDEKPSDEAPSDEAAEEAAAEEADHPTDAPAAGEKSEERAEKPADSDADDGDRVVTRG